MTTNSGTPYNRERIIPLSPSSVCSCSEHGHAGLPGRPPSFHVLMGTKSSGNWGHEGRPGEVGGSGPGGNADWNGPDGDDLAGRLSKKYGKAEKLHTDGFILPNGTYVSFKGKVHAEVIKSIMTAKERSSKPNEMTYVEVALNAGLIRSASDTNALEMIGEPSPKQYETLLRLFNHLYMTRPVGSLSWVGYAMRHDFTDREEYQTMPKTEGNTPEYVIGVIKSYFATPKKQYDSVLASFRGNIYNPDQPRDEAGKWTSGSSTPSNEHEQGMHDNLSQMAKMYAENGMGNRTAWAYSSNEQMVLANGKFYKPQKLPPGYSVGTPKQCYRNAAMLAQSHKDLTYVEGYVYPTAAIPLPIMHAWCADKAGNVIDPTLAKGDVPVYFGIPLDTKWLWGHLAKTKVYGVLADYHDPLVIKGLPPGAIKSDSGSKKLRVNAIPPHVNSRPKGLAARRIDAPGITMLERRFTAEAVRRLRRIKRAVYNLVVTDDCFGLVNPLHVLAFDPDQPRDEDGQWTSGGGLTYELAKPSNVVQDSATWKKFGSSYQVKHGGKLVATIKADRYGKSYRQGSSWDVDVVSELGKPLASFGAQSTLAKAKALLERRLPDVLKYHGIKANAKQFAFNTKADQVDAFIQWLENLNEKELLDVYVTSTKRKFVGSKHWSQIYIQAAYKKGMQFSASKLKKKGLKPTTYGDPLMFGGAVKSAPYPVDYLFNGPIHADRVGLIFTRAYNELKGVSAAMGQRMARVLAQGLAEGRGPRQIARQLDEAVDGIGIVRATMIARTEIMRAHHVGAINTYREAGLELVRVQGEWATARDDKVCDACAELDGKVFTLDEIEPMIPYHPNCRCVCLPVLDPKKMVEE